MSLDGGNYDEDAFDDGLAIEQDAMVRRLRQSKGLPMDSQGTGSPGGMGNTGKPANTGVSGYGRDGGMTTPSVDPSPRPVADPPAASFVADPPVASAPAKQYGLEGFDAKKLSDPAHTTPKYQIGRTLQNFDPKGGLQQNGLLDALNKLGIGQFSANSDKLSVAGGDPRFEGMNTWDSIRDQEGNAGWQFGVDSNLDAMSAPQGGMPGAAGPSSFGGIQSLAPTDTGSYNRLQQMLAEILGGQQAFDQEALFNRLSQR